MNKLTIYGIIAFIIIAFSNIQLSYADIFDPLAKQLEDFMRVPITNDSQRIKSPVTEQEYNDRIAELNKLLKEINHPEYPLILPFKESCYYHEDDKYLYETYQCTKMERMNKTNLNHD